MIASRPICLPGMGQTRGFRIEAPHLVAGGDVQDGRCVRAAPIIRYMEGWTEERIGDYCRCKGWACGWSGGSTC